MKTKGHVRGSWTNNDNADIWEKHKNLFLRQKILAHTSIIVPIIKKIKKEKSLILELGCGSGNYSIFLALLGYKVLASDIERSAIELTKARAQIHLPDSKKNNLICMILDAQDMSLSDDSVDVVFNVGAIEHLDIEKVLKECSRVLKKDGWVISAVPFLSLRWDLFWKLSCYMSKCNPYTQFLSKKEWFEIHSKEFKNILIEPCSFILEAIFIRIFGASLDYAQILPKILNTEILVIGQKK